MLAIHMIFTAYGFWLPNDPRGSQSDFVWAWELFWFGGPATKVDAGTRKSVAKHRHDRALREAAKRKLKYSPVHFTDDQIHELAQAFHETINQFDMRVYACAILPEHVHIVLRTGRMDINGAMNQLKGHASRRLSDREQHPFQHERTTAGARPTMWAERGWNVFLDTPEDVHRSVVYVKNNPLREGRPAQIYDFEEPFVR